MTRTAPREGEESEDNVRAWNPRVYLFKWHNSFRQTSKNHQLISEPFSSPVKTPTLSGHMALKFTRYIFCCGLRSGFSSTCYLPTVRLYALKRKVVKPIPFVCSLSVKKPTGTSRSTPTSHGLFILCICCFCLRDNCTPETDSCSTLQAWICICKNEQMQIQMHIYCTH